MTGPRTHYVYRAYDQFGHCLYVGKTKELAHRRQSHRRSVWYSAADTCVVRGPYTADMAAKVERELIAYLLPIYNRTYKPFGRREISSRHLRDIAQKHPGLPPYRIKEMPRDVFEAIASRRPEAISWDADVATIFDTEYRIEA